MGGSSRIPHLHICVWLHSEQVGGRLALQVRSVQPWWKKSSLAIHATMQGRLWLEAGTESVVRVMSQPPWGDGACGLLAPPGVPEER